MKKFLLISIIFLGGCCSSHKTQIYPPQPTYYNQISDTELSADIKGDTYDKGPNKWTWDSLPLSLFNSWKEYFKDDPEFKNR